MGYNMGMWFNKAPKNTETKEQKETRIRTEIERLKQDIRDIRAEDLLHAQAINEKGIGQSQAEHATLEANNNTVIALRQQIVGLANEIGIDPEIQDLF